MVEIKKHSMKSIKQNCEKKLGSLLNKNDVFLCRIEFTSKFRLAKKGPEKTVSAEEVCTYVSGLEESECPTVVGIPNTVYELANARLHKLRANFIVVYCFMFI